MSLRSAVNSKCKECLYNSGERGGWRQQIEACTAYPCPLFDVRPKPKKAQRTPRRHLDGNFPLEGSNTIAPVKIVDSSTGKHPSRPENQLHSKREA